MAHITLDLAHSYKPQPQQDSDYALLPLKMEFRDGGAYALLSDEGLVEMRRSRGVVVTGAAPATAGVVERARALVDEARRHGLRDDEIRRIVEGQL